MVDAQRSEPCPAAERVWGKGAHRTLGVICCWRVLNESGCMVCTDQQLDSYIAFAAASGSRCLRSKINNSVPAQAHTATGAHINNAA
jgi:hypothetical protein